MNAATVTPNDLGVMLIYAVRYAMGRATSAPHDVAACVRRYAPHLTPGDLAVIRRDLRAALDRGAVLGHAEDHAEWERLAVWLDGHAQSVGVR